jgi:histidine triad (HIT) family protein
MADCIFCRIAAGELPSAIVREDDQAVAFRDTNPQAPTHVLIVPRRHIASLDAAVPDDRSVLGHLLLLAQQIARDEGLNSGYRLVLNTGSGAGQTVFHLHLHLLGGRTLNWPPG